MPDFHLVTGPDTRVPLRTVSTASAPSPQPPWLAQYVGQPPPGTVLWGSSLSGNTDPYTKHEQPTGVPLSVRRTFQPAWSQANVNSLVSIARDDITAGRLPWVSIKPAAWTDMASGSQDGLIDSMLTQLAVLPGPVWLTVHHEPDGGGGSDAPDDPAGPAGHLAMNAHVRDRMTSLGLTNVALAPVLMSYSWEYSAPHRDPDLWWDGDVYDFMGVDHYRDSTSLLTPRWTRVRQWGAAHGCDINVGEWGLKDYTGVEQYITEWHDMAAGSHDDAGLARVCGTCYFDSDNNTSGGGYTLTGPRLSTFHDMMLDPATTRWPDYWPT